MVGGNDTWRLQGKRNAAAQMRGLRKKETSQKKHTGERRIVSHPEDTGNVG